MKNDALTYAGYVARIEFDSRDNIFVGRVLGIEDSITFHGDSESQLAEAFRLAVDSYLLDCEVTGRRPQMPPSAA